MRASINRERTKMINMKIRLNSTSLIYLHRERMLQAHGAPHELPTALEAKITGVTGEGNGALDDSVHRLIPSLTSHRRSVREPRTARQVEIREI